MSSQTSSSPHEVTPLIDLFMLHHPHIILSWPMALLHSIWHVSFWHVEPLDKLLKFYAPVNINEAGRIDSRLKAILGFLRMLWFPPIIPKHTVRSMSVTEIVMCLCIWILQWTGDLLGVWRIRVLMCVASVATSLYIGLSGKTRWRMDDFSFLVPIIRRKSTITLKLLKFSNLSK